MPKSDARRLAAWTCLAAAAAVLTASALAADHASAADAKKKIVLVAGRPSHGYGGHEHRAGCLLLAKCLNENVPGVEAVVCEHGWPEDPKVMKGAAAVVAFSDGNNSHSFAGHLEEVDQMAKGGVGVGLIHYAVEMPKDGGGQLLKEWTGGFFETFWSINPHWKAEFTSFPDHPVARGLKPFAVDDEWYYHMRFVERMEGVTPILSTVPPESTLARPDGAHSNNPFVRAEKGQPQHLMWVRQRADGGRGFGFTGGHWHWNWAQDSFRTAVLNGIVWSAGLEVPPGGVPSRTPTFEELQENQDFAPDANPKRPFDPKPWIELLDSWRKGS